MSERTWMKKCCGLCPFSAKDTLWLTPKRAEEFAYMATNPYTDFPCHKTADYDEGDDYREGGYVHGQNSFTCHGFKTLQAASCWSEKEYENYGFESDGAGFEDPDDMVYHHQHNRP